MVAPPAAEALLSLDPLQFRFSSLPFPEKNGNPFADYVSPFDRGEGPRKFAPQRAVFKVVQEELGVEGLDVTMP